MIVSLFLRSPEERIVSRIVEETSRDSSFQNVHVEFPRKLGLKVVGNVPDESAMSELKAIVNRHADNPKRIIWRVTVSNGDPTQESMRIDSTRPGTIDLEQRSGINGDRAF